MKMIVTCLAPGDRILLDIGDDTKCRDDGKGMVELKQGSSGVGWFNTNTGHLAIDERLVVQNAPISAPNVPDVEPPPASIPTDAIPPAAAPVVPPAPLRPPGV